ncbi:hypothetical protein AUR64_01555 [Haloprofundus marisrubri]|uniref:Uncharacterized protein n=1 Tax=Haloprofundus marisrubri TaxID=1514971 RepID=A0A0W1R410_9EURY|nr:hypothetical protein [Haloprofundus marisrubri]KTG07948.1 hypothetical protein AUR64_01555 [Haloprofundus marisrubri]
MKMDDTYLRLRSREDLLQIIQDKLIPHLDNTEWREEYHPDNDSVEQSAEALAEEFYDLAVPGCYSLVVVVILLSAVDYLIHLNPQVYGLFIDVWAALFFVFPSLKGRYVMATAVDGLPREAMNRLEAQNMVSNTVGFVMLAVGFLLQIVAVQMFSSSEFLQSNILGDFAPNWIALLFLGFVLFFGFKSLYHFRGKRLSGRDSLHSR